MCYARARASLHVLSRSECSLCAWTSSTLCPPQHWDLPETQRLAKHAVGVLFGREHQHRLSLLEAVRKARCQIDTTAVAHSIQSGGTTLRTTARTRHCVDGGSAARPRQDQCDCLQASSPRGHGPAQQLMSSVGPTGPMVWAPLMGRLENFSFPRFEVCQGLV